MLKLNKNEKILRVYRRHWFVIFVKFFSFGISMLLISIIEFFIFLKTQDYEFRIFSLFLYTLFMLILLVSLCITFIDYWLDTWIVTTERIIDIEQKGLFVRDFSEFKISKIQNLNIQVTGFLPTLLNFGDLKIETASENETFIFRQIPNPYKAKAEILKTYDEYVRTHKYELLKNV